MEFETSELFIDTKNLKTYSLLSPVAKEQSKRLKSPKAAEELTTKNAVTFLLNGSLRSKVCKYCLNVTEELFELERVMEIASRGAMYSVTVKDMIACFHPFKVTSDPNLPDKICDICLDRTISSYLFTQQCDQAGRALSNFLEDIDCKLSKLDPIEPKHRRGKRKIYINYNKIHVEHSNVIDYAEPVMHIINTNTNEISNEPVINPLECLKCCQVLPDFQSFANHSKTHPQSMWFSCRLCGLSFPKLYLIKRHYLQHLRKTPTKEIDKAFECKKCGEKNTMYHKHLQHVEKHRFKMVLEHLVNRKMDELCAVCLDKGSLVPLNKLVCLHGGPPDLMGDRTMQSILASTLPEMSFQSSYTGSQICEKCVNSAITAYAFMSQTYFVRDRLNTCLSLMLDNLNIEPENNLCIEISQESILPIKEPVGDVIEIEDKDLMKEDFLEDEYRIKSEDEESEAEGKESKSETTENILINCINTENNLCEYPIDVCKEFLSFKGLNKQKKIHNQFTCPVCSKQFLSKYFFKIHVLKHIQRKISCKHCGTEFSSKFALNEHTKYAHVLFQSDYRTCNICGRGFAKPSKLQLHEKQHRNKECPLCNKVFKTQHHFDVHLKRHIPKFMMIETEHGQSCSFCEKQCSNDHQLSLHVNKVHLQIKPYSCDMCERQFYTEINLHWHKKLHSKLTKEKCNFCYKILKSRMKLVIHIRKHIGVCPFKCQLCIQSFYSKSKLKQHMIAIHGGSVVCKICKHATVSKNGLKQHVTKAHNFI